MGLNTAGGLYTEGDLYADNIMRLVHVSFLASTQNVKKKKRLGET